MAPVAEVDMEGYREAGSRAVTAELSPVWSTLASGKPAGNDVIPFHMWKLPELRSLILPYINSNVLRSDPPRKRLFHTLCLHKTP